MARPLNYIRVRLYRGGQAEYVRSVLEDERVGLMEDLSQMRTAGKTEDDPEIQTCTANIRHLNNALKDIMNGLIELVGPEPEA
jgi:hypothetical protein